MCGCPRKYHAYPVLPLGQEIRLGHQALGGWRKEASPFSLPVPEKSHPKGRSFLSPRDRGVIACLGLRCTPASPRVLPCTPGAACRSPGSGLSSLGTPARGTAQRRCPVPAPHHARSRRSGPPAARAPACSPRPPPALTPFRSAALLCSRPHCSAPQPLSDFSASSLLSPRLSPTGQTGGALLPPTGGCAGPLQRLLSGQYPAGVGRWEGRRGPGGGEAEQICFFTRCRPVGFG